MKRTRSRTDAPTLPPRSEESDADESEASEDDDDHENVESPADDGASADELSAEAERAAEPALDSESKAQLSEGAALSFDDHVAPTESFDQPAGDGPPPALTEASGLAPIEISAPAESAEEAEALNEEFDEPSSSESGDID